MPQLEDLTVVVPTRNEARNIGLFLHSLPAEVSLIVVDNSEDDTVDVVARERAPRTQVLRFPGTLTEARQVGADCARTGWLLFTDADLRFAEDYFRRLEACSGDVIYGPKLSLDRYRRYYAGFAKCQGLVHALGIPAASGSNLVVRRTALRAAGGFDLRLPCNEDSELVWRLKCQGFRCRFDPRLRVWATDHRRLDRGRLRKTLHSVSRCTLLYSGLLPQRWRESDWGYWANADSSS